MNQNELNDYWAGVKEIPVVEVEYRLYYDNDGNITMFSESDHPEGNYVVIDNPDIFLKHNTQLLKVVDGKLKITDPTVPLRGRLTKSTTGQPVVKGHAALALNVGEEYIEVEYYDRKADN